MCVYTVFHFLCGGTKLKIATPCPQISTNSQDVPFCHTDPYPHLLDGKLRAYAPQTYGPGICSNTHCRVNWGMIAASEHDKCQPQDLIEDESEFDMFPDTCQQREDIWYQKCLNPEQQHEFAHTIFPLPREEMSLYAKFWLFGDDISPDEWLANHEEAAQANPDIMKWQELNPKYLSQKSLAHVTGLYLPACVTDPQHPSSAEEGHRTTTPAWPQFGPFRCKSHWCLPAVGICETCGIHHGEEFKERPAWYDASLDWAARAEMAKEKKEAGGGEEEEEMDGHMQQVMRMPIEALGPLCQPGDEAIEWMDQGEAVLMQVDDGLSPLPYEDLDPELQRFLDEMPDLAAFESSSAPLTINTDIASRPLTAEELQTMSAIPTATTGSFWSRAQTPLTALTDLGEDPFLDQASAGENEKQNGEFNKEGNGGKASMRYPRDGGREISTDEEFEMLDR